jgi:PHP domain-containing protein
VASPAALHDATCVVHLHSTYSDGTGTVPEIAAAARANGLDVVLLTDHDTLEARRTGEEGWHGDVLVLVGEEVSPYGGNHYLAFGIDDEVEHEGLDPAGICSAVSEQGGFGFAAHPFSEGSPRFERARAMPWRDLDCRGLDGLEVWSFVTDTAERLESVRDVLRFIVRPGHAVDHPPARNLAEWDRLGRERRVVGIGGLDAHQIGLRVGGRVPLRLMSYRRSFRYLHTHVLCEEPLSRELQRDRELVYGALRKGCCFIAMDSLASARGFTFHAEGANGSVLTMGAEAGAGEWTLRAAVPRPARLRLLRDGVQIAGVEGAALEHSAEGPGVYRIEARLDAMGRERTWILSNSIYLR